MTENCAQVVVIPAGVPRKPGMTRDDLFETNAGIVFCIIKQAAESCPDAMIAIITNPVNTCVPIAATVLEKEKCFDPNRLFGVSTLDVVRARRFIATQMCCDPRTVDIPVIGGHSGITIIPILSQSKPKYKGTEEEIQKLTVRIQDAGTEVVNAKAGKGSATLSTAYASAQFVDSLLKAMSGKRDIIECSYVKSNVTSADFFATPLLLGKDGIEKNLCMPSMNAFEKKLVETAIPALKQEIEKGYKFAKDNLK